MQHKNYTLELDSVYGAVRSSLVILNNLQYASASKAFKNFGRIVLRSALGKVQGMTKELGYPVICSSEVADALGQSAELVDLGERSIRGHAPMHLFGWRPAILEKLG